MGIGTRFNNRHDLKKAGKNTAMEAQQRIDNYHAKTGYPTSLFVGGADPYDVEDPGWDAHKGSF